MPIEWWPRRPRAGTPWGDEVAEQYPVTAPFLVHQDTATAVVVPIRPRELLGPDRVDGGFRRRMRRRSPLDEAVLVLGGVLATTVGVLAGPSAAPFEVVGPSLVLAGAVRTALAPPMARREPGGASLVVGPGGLAVDGLRIPWSAVGAVVTFRTRLELEDVLFPDRGRASWLALRVTDFDEVLGLSPFRAGLANLTRRRLVVLLEASEVARPQALRDGLAHLVENPEARASLATPDGLRLLTQGPG